jgi:5-(hydroxymethyl)furfural/furfural oxidase
VTADPLSQVFDIAIVGAGAAGCVLASRLSEDAGKRVLLLEAGPDAPVGAEHPDILDPFPVSWGNPDFSFPELPAELGAEQGDGSQRLSGPYIQGYGVGGGSNINGMAVDRGVPADYDEWERQGAEGWGWKGVLPFFNKLENDLDFSGRLHGNTGPMPVRRIPRDDWPPFCASLGDAFERRQFGFVPDCNAEFGAGFSPTPMNAMPDRRVSASTAYPGRQRCRAARCRRRRALSLPAHAERSEQGDGAGDRAGERRLAEPGPADAIRHRSRSASPVARHRCRP